MEFKIRFATREDCPTILFFIEQLAIYENMLDDVVATADSLESWIFDKKKAEVLIFTEDGKEIGFSLFFTNFSTFLGRAGLYLEDLFILEPYRNKGYGKKVLKYLANLAIERGYGRFEWVCLDWNSPSLEFYSSLGAKQQNSWIIHRLEGTDLENMAKY